LLRHRVAGAANAVTLTAGAEPASAAVDYGSHDINTPSNWNGRKIYISPGHFSYDPRPFPCGSYSTSEYQKAWHAGYALRDALFAQGYMIMMPRRVNDVGYTNRVDTAFDWWSNKSNDRFLYVAIHTNAGTTCPDNGGSQTLAQDSYDGGLDTSVAGRPGGVFEHLQAASPGNSTRERLIRDRCTGAYSQTVYEICSSQAVTMRTIFVESDYHSTDRGANWIATSEQTIAAKIRNGINCFYFGGVWCSV
jgi:hypothetical protein